MSAMITAGEKIDAIVAACVRANPTLGASSVRLVEQVRLVHVEWLFMQDVRDTRSAENIENLAAWWSIRNDSLAGQSDECVGFIHDAIRSMKL